MPNDLLPSTWGFFGAGLIEYFYDAAAAQPKFRGIAAGLHFELLHRVHGRKNRERLEVIRRRRRWHSVQQHVGCARTPPVDIELQSLKVVPNAPRDPRRKQNEAEWVSLVQRQVLDAARPASL